MAGWLASFAYLRKRSNAPLLKGLLQQHEAGVPTMVDSGAFTANASGEPISLEEYGQFVETNQDRLGHFVQLDVIRSKEEARTNLAWHLERGHRIMAVLTSDAPAADAPELCEGADGLCVAGNPLLSRANYFGNAKNLKEATANFWARIAYVRSVCPTARLHALGVSGKKDALMSSLDSCDSSTWAAAGRFGGIVRRDVFVGVSQVRRRTKCAGELARKLGLDYGLTAAKLKDRSHKTCGVETRIAVCVAEWVRYAWDCARMGLTFYQALTTWQHFKYFTAAARLLGYKSWDELFLPESIKKGRR